MRTFSTIARAVIARHGKTFALASRLLPRPVREDAVILYAYCRRVDDAIDAVPLDEQPLALQRMRVELDVLYGQAQPSDPLLLAMHELVARRGVPRAYLEELLAGMEMDVAGARYATLQELLVYAHRVAGVVGLMMCHVMGVRGQRALVHAAHLGIAMQLTNIARDVAEDWDRGRCYLPAELLARHGASACDPSLGGAFPREALPGVAAAIESLLTCADGYYRSGVAGLRDLSPRCALAVDAAQLLYADIGRVLRERACDPLGGRAFVGMARKSWLLGRALFRALLRLPALRLQATHASLRVLPREAAVSVPPGGVL